MTHMTNNTEIGLKDVIRDTNKTLAEGRLGQVHLLFVGTATVSEVSITTMDKDATHFKFFEIRFREGAPIDVKSYYGTSGVAKSMLNVFAQTNITHLETFDIDGETLIQWSR